MFLNNLTTRLAKLGPVGATLTAVVGGAFGYLVQTGSLEAAAQVLISTLASKGVWGGAAAAGIIAGLGKAVAGRTPSAQ